MDLLNHFEVPTTRALGSLDKPISVAELTDRIKFSLEKEFFEVVIIGEISNFKAHPSGHFYFNLKDEKANLTAVMFRGDNSKIKFKAHDGLKVIAVGKITVYPPRGNYQILVSRMEPEGLGALQLAFEQLKKKLEAEGLFRTERKRPIPKFPRAVGIVTSPSGAAIRDILQILDRRFSGLRVLIYPVKVQGVGAAEEIAQAIQDFNAHFSELDVLIVGRGGGSIEDLWAFNEEVVARSIFQSKMPVISAVGHEVDFTIADFVADLRAPTPSAAAELVIGSKLELITRLDHLMKRLLLVQKLLEFTEMKVDDLFQRLTHVLQQKISALKFEVEKLNAALFRFSPMALLQNQKQKFFYLSDKLYEIPAQHIEDTRVSIQHLEEKLRLLNPRAIMERGYSIVRNVQTMKVIKKVSDVKMGDKLLIELSKGKITAKV